MNRGQWIILTMLALAVGMSIFAWSYRYQQSRRLMEFWGAETTWRIRKCERVEMMRLEYGKPDSLVGSAVDPAQKTLLNGLTWETLSRAETDQPLPADDDEKTLVWKDISQTPGLIHARHALLQNANFYWKREPPNAQPRWNYLLRFSHQGESDLVALDFQNLRLWRLETGESVTVKPLIPRMRKFLRLQYAKPQE